MPRYKVVVFERMIKRTTKIFEAETAAEAEDLAYAENWVPENGWQIVEEHEPENYILNVRAEEE